jgi:hypothetical protein
VRARKVAGVFRVYNSVAKDATATLDMEDVEALIPKWMARKIIKRAQELRAVIEQTRPLLIQRDFTGTLLAYDELMRQLDKLSSPRHMADSTAQQAMSAMLGHRDR